MYHASQTAEQLCKKGQAVPFGRKEESVSTGEAASCPILGLSGSVILSLLLLPPPFFLSVSVTVSLSLSPPLPSCPLPSLPPSLFFSLHRVWRRLLGNLSYFLTEMIRELGQLEDSLGLNCAAILHFTLPTILSKLGLALQ